MLGLELVGERFDTSKCRGCDAEDDCAAGVFLNTMATEVDTSEAIGLRAAERMTEAFQVGPKAEGVSKIADETKIEYLALVETLADAVEASGAFIQQIMVAQELGPGRVFDTDYLSQPSREQLEEAVGGLTVTRVFEEVNVNEIPLDVRRFAEAGICGAYDITAQEEATV